MKKMFICKVCGKPFVSYVTKNRTRVTCSFACSDIRRSYVLQRKFARMRKSRRKGR